ncbi:MAG: hemolysin, partial [Actinomycetota bacterium]
MDHLDIRPTWRGVLHLGAVPVFAIAFAVLAARTPTADKDRAAVVVYAFGVLAMFAVSATYHATTRKPRSITRLLQRLDHAAILLAIAGTYTAVTALAIHGPRRGQLLAAMWALALIGTVVQVLIVRAPRWVGAVGYLLVGWFAAFDAPAYLRGTTTAEFTWVVVGGLLYTAGAIVYALKRPD